MLVELAIGDAYGAAFEFVPSALTDAHRLGEYQRHPRHSIEPGRYTDDTQMSIALAELVVSGAEFSRENVADVFVAAYKRDPRPGYARGFQQLLDEIESGADLLARIRPTSHKNGAAMRAAPLGVYRDTDLVIERATLQARLTHDTEEGIAAAVAVALMTHYFLYALGANRELPYYIAKYVPGPWQDAWHGRVDVQGYSAVRAALRAVSSSSSLSAILERCVGFGGDTDTVGAIAMAVASCSDQVEADLPKRLVSGLEDGTYGREFLRDLDQRLLSLVAHPEVRQTDVKNKHPS